MDHLAPLPEDCPTRPSGSPSTVRRSAREVKHPRSGRAGRDVLSWRPWAGVPSPGRWPALVQIIAMIKPFRAQAVLAALEPIEILGGTVREAMGFGRQKNRLHRYLGSEYNASFL